MKISESTEFKIDLKTVVSIIVITSMFMTMYFTLQADIEEAKELPVPPPPDVTRMEYDMKDQLIRQTIQTTADDVSEIKDDMKRLEEKIDKLR